jgi:TonB family protein
MIEEVSMSRVRSAVSPTLIVFLLAGGVAAAVHAFPLGAGVQSSSAASPGEGRAAAEGESSPRLAHAVEPVYPEAARRAGVSGLVILEVTIDESGEVSRVRSVRAHPMLVPAAEEAVRRSRWEPRRVDGAPASTVVRVRLVFPRGGTPFWESPSPDGTRPDGEEEPEPAAVGREAVRVTKSVHTGRLVRRVEPVYPEEARRQRVSGVVLIQATIDESGAVVDARPIRGHPMLISAAVEAVRQWLYEPTRIEEDEPVPVVTTVMLEFRLTDPPS